MLRYYLLFALCAIALVTAPPRCAVADAAVTLTLSEVVDKALARDALVRDAQRSLENARATLVRVKTHTPRLSVSSNTSAASSAGLDPQSAVTGTSYSSQSYDSGISMPLGGGVGVSLNTSASTSTTNSSLRTGEGMSFTFAGAAVGAGVSGPVPLFRDERALTEGGRWSAEMSLRSAEMALEEAKRNVVSGALTNFFAAVQAQRQAEIAEASQQNAEELLRIAQEKLKLGKIAEIDVTEAQVSADSARTTVRRAQSAAANALDALKNFLGVPLDQALQVSHEDTIPDEVTESAEAEGQPQQFPPPEWGRVRVGVIPPHLSPPPQGGRRIAVDPVSGAAETLLSPSPDTLDESTLLQKALAQRVDLQQLALGIKQSELSVRQTEAYARPGVSLGAGYTRSGEAPTIAESFNLLVNPSWYVGLSTSVSLTHKADEAAIQQARGSLRLARLNEQLQKDEVRLEIRRLLREVQDAAANATLLAKTVAQAEENLRIRQVQYDHGLIRPIDVMQTERQLVDARTGYSDALINYQLARARLSLAVGETPEFSRR